MKKFLSVVAVACVFLSAVVRAEPIVPDELPQDVGVFVESPDINAAATELQKFVSQVAPGVMIPAPGMMLPQFAFKTTQPNTVDLSKPLQLIVLLPPLHEQPALIFSVTDKDAYLKSIALPKKETDGNLHVFQGRGPDFIVAVEGKRAVMSPSREVAKRVAGMIADGKFGAERLLPDGHIALAVRPAAALPKLREAGMDPFGLVRQQMQAQAAMSGEEGVQEAMKIADIQFQAFQNLVEQTRGLTVAVEFSEQAIVFHDKAQAVEGSGLDDYFQSIPGGEMETLSHMPADAIAFYATKFGDLKPAFNWVRAATNDADLQSEQLDEAFPVMENWLNAIGSEVSQAAAVTEGGKLSAVGAMTMKDTGNIEELLKGAGEMAKAMTPLQNMPNAPKVETTVTPNAQTYNGVQLHEMAMKVELPEPGPEMPAQAVAMQRAMFDLFGGTDSKSYSAIIDGDYIYTQGAGSLEAIKAVIDRDQGIAGADALKAAQAQSGQNAVLVGFVSVADAVNFALDYAAQKAGQNAPPALQNIRMQAADPLTFSSSVLPDSVATFKMTFPVSIAKSGFQAGMQFQQAMQGGAGGGAPGRGPMLP